MEYIQNSDIFKHIKKYLNTNDIISLETTCSRLYHIFKTDIYFLGISKHKKCTDQSFLIKCKKQFELQDKLLNICPFIFDENFPWSDSMILAGGIINLVLDETLNPEDYPSSDIDIFVMNDSQQVQKLCNFFAKLNGTYKQYYGLINIYVPDYNRTFQIINHFGKDVLSILNSFNYSYLKCAYYNHEFVMLPDCEYSIQYKIAIPRSLNAYTIVKTLKKGYKIIGIDNSINYEKSNQYKAKMKTFQELGNSKARKITNSTHLVAKLFNVYRSSERQMSENILQIADLIGYNAANIITKLDEFRPDSSLTKLNVNKVKFSSVKTEEPVTYINTSNDTYAHKINGITINPGFMVEALNISFSTAGKFIHTKEKYNWGKSEKYMDMEFRRSITKNYAFVFEDIKIFMNIKQQIHNIFMKYYHKNNQAQEILAGLYHGEVYDPEIMSDKLCDGTIIRTHLSKNIKSNFRKKNKKTFVEIPCSVTFNVYLHKNVIINNKCFSTLGGVTFVVDDIKAL